MVIEVGGVGYVVRVPLQTSLPEGQTISLFIHTAVREDAIDLYGFLTEEELSFFKQLMSVSGVGPKTALGIVNVSDIASLTRAIAAGDSATLIKVFGIGKKTAERIVVELREKVIRSDQDTTPAGALSDIEVIEALQTLGYRAEESRRALKEVSGASTQDRLAAALKYLGAVKV